MPSTSPPHSFAASAERQPDEPHPNRVDDRPSRHDAEPPPFATPRVVEVTRAGHSFTRDWRLPIRVV